jgi:hypothetical protein
MVREPLQFILRMRSKKGVDEAFDMLIFNAYLMGDAKGMIPVEESRECFEHLKKLLLK